MKLQLDSLQNRAIMLPLPGRKARLATVIFLLLDCAQQCLRALSSAGLHSSSALPIPVALACLPPPHLCVKGCRLSVSQYQITRKLLFQQKRTRKGCLKIHLFLLKSPQAVVKPCYRKDQTQLGTAYRWHPDLLTKNYLSPASEVSFRSFQPAP
jgi:hypothetical protein